MLDQPMFAGGTYDIEELPGGHNFIIYQLETGIHLANVGDSNDGPGHGVLPGNKILATAHLFAAAPDLYAALVEITNAYASDRLTEFNEIERENEIIIKARAAINKALNK